MSPGNWVVVDIFYQTAGYSLTLSVYRSISFPCSHPKSSLNCPDESIIINDQSRWYMIVYRQTRRSYMIVKQMCRILSYTIVYDRKTYVSYTIVYDRIPPKNKCGVYYRIRSYMIVKQTCCVRSYTIVYDRKTNALNTIVYDRKTNVLHTIVYDRIWSYTIVVVYDRLWP